MMETLLFAQEALPLANWTIENALENTRSSLYSLGGLFFGVVGIVLLVVGGTMFAKKLMSERDQTSWVKIILMVLFGGILAFAGGSLIFDVGRGADQSIRDIGE